MKHSITAAIAAFLLLFCMCMTAYADPVDGSDTSIATEYDAVGNPFTPAGTGTVVNAATDGDGKEFYTIMASDETVFYLVIDRQRSAENVYFLNAVTVDDLMSLAGQPTMTQNGGTVAVPTPTPGAEQPAETPSPAQQEQGGNNTGMLIIIIVLAAIGGGAAWYFKIYRPKQQGGDAEEYEPPADEETGFDDWDEQEDDTPPWDEETEESEVDE